MDIDIYSIISCMLTEKKTKQMHTSRNVRNMLLDALPTLVSVRLVETDASSEGGASPNIQP